MRGKKKCCIFTSFLTEEIFRKAKCKDEDVEYTSELEREEHGEIVNIIQTNTKIRVEEEFQAGINVVKEIEGDNDDVSKEESPSTFSEDMYEYEEGNYEVTGNKEIEQANTEIAVYEDIAFWP